MTDLDKLIEIFRFFHEGIYIVNSHRKILYFNPKAESISGYGKDEVIGKYCYNNILNHIDEKGTKLCIMGCPLEETIRTNKVNQGDIYLHHKDGHRVKVGVKTIPYLCENGERFGIEVFEDLTNVESVQQYFEEDVQVNYIDELTKVFNRKYFNDVLKGDKNYFKDGNHAVLFIDIDNFKILNDNYGHHIGDKMLKNVASTLMSNLRKDDKTTRYGGEEFVVFLRNIELDDLKKITEKLRLLTEASFVKTEKENISATISIGAAMFQKHSDLTAAVIRSDKAMYEAKKDGKNKVVIV